MLALRAIRRVSLSVLPLCLALCFAVYAFLLECLDLRGLGSCERGKTDDIRSMV